MAAKGKCRAAGMAIDTRLKAAPRKQDVGKDAIWIILEQKSGDSQGVIVPYAKSLQGRFSYFSAFTQPERPRIFLTVNWLNGSGSADCCQADARDRILFGSVAGRKFGVIGLAFWQDH
jgi:hypothetical protein